MPVNVGNPQEISLKDFAEEIIKLTGTKQKIVYKPLPVDDPKQRQPDITKAKVLGWEPKVSREEGLKKTYDYFKSLPEADLYKLPKEFIEQNVEVTHCRRDVKIVLMENDTVASTSVRLRRNFSEERLRGLVNAELN